MITSSARHAPRRGGSQTLGAFKLDQTVKVASEVGAGDRPGRRQQFYAVRRTANRRPLGRRRVGNRVLICARPRVTARRTRTVRQLLVLLLVQAVLVVMVVEVVILLLLLAIVLMVVVYLNLALWCVGVLLVLLVLLLVMVLLEVVPRHISDRSYVL